MQGRLQGILFLGSLLPQDISDSNPYGSGAANNFQYNLLAGLAGRGVERIEALTLYPVPAYPRSNHCYWGRSQHRLSDWIRVTVLGFSNLGPLKPPSQMVSVLWQIFNMWFRRSFNPDIVLTYNAPQRIAMPAILAGKLFRVPVVCIAADVQPWKPLSVRVKDIIARLRGYWIRRYDGVIVLSGRVAEDFCRGQRTIRVEGAASIEEFQRLPASASEQDSLKEDIYTILYAGTLVELCGVGLLLAAFDQIKDERYRLCFLGRGPMEKEINIAMRGDSRIRYYGWIDRDAYVDSLKNATILVNPRLTSFPENRYNFPAKLLEYLASGRPVITTATADVREEYGDLAYVLPEETPVALANLVEEVCQLPPKDLLEFGARAREYVLNNKNWDVQAERVKDFLVEIIDEYRRRRS